TGAWRSDGSTTPARWLAKKTGTSTSDAIGTVELGEQLEALPEVADAARRGRLSPVQTKLIAKATSKDPASEEHLVNTARHGSMTKLRQECAAASQRGVWGRRRWRSFMTAAITATGSIPKMVRSATRAA